MAGGLFRAVAARPRARWWDKASATSALACPRGCSPARAMVGQTRTRVGLSFFWSLLARARLGAKQICNFCRFVLAGPRAPGGQISEVQFLPFSTPRPRAMEGHPAPAGMPRACTRLALRLEEAIKMRRKNNRTTNCPIVLMTPATTKPPRNPRGDREARRRWYRNRSQRKFQAFQNLATDTKQVTCGKSGRCIEPIEIRLDAFKT